ncbi:MAG: hypothetical protein ACJA0C_000850 [Candidatus Endobugula sp.]|jgi:hypothetical protein
MSPSICQATANDVQSVAILFDQYRVFFMSNKATSH